MYEELARVTARELRDLAERGPADAELARAKAVLKAGLWMADESLASRSGRIAAQLLIFGDIRPTALQVDEIEAVTADDLRRVGARLLDPRRSATAVLGPKAAARAGRAFQEALFA